MKFSSYLPYDQVFWYLKKSHVQPLKENITTDVVVLGGGMSGTAAAQSFAKKGLKVVLLEKNYCGSGASGKTSGFITPDSELPLRFFVKSYGATEAKRLWEFISSGVRLIQNNIVEYNLDCDYFVQDSFVVANTEDAFTAEIQAEHNARQQLNYQSTLYNKQQIQEVLGSDQYQGAVRYTNTFSIQGYGYCSGMKRVLQESGVRVHEETPVIDIQDHIVTTPHAQVKAEHIIVCTDWFTRSLKTCQDLIYHFQSYLMLSEPLSPAQIKQIFPQAPFLVWDTDLIYHYFRLTGENRLLLGGASLFDTYSSQEKHNNKHIVKKLSQYFKTKFPNISLQFEYVWPGLLGVSKDLFPIAGHDKQMPSVYYVAAAAGLPWAAAIGAHSANRILHNETSFDHYFSPYRAFTLGPITQRILGTKLTFALSNYLTTNSI